MDVFAKMKGKYLANKKTVLHTPKKVSNVGHAAMSNIGHTNHCLSYYQSVLSFKTSFAHP